MWMFDSDPAATNTCGAEVKRCEIATPYAQKQINLMFSEVPIKWQEF